MPYIITKKPRLGGAFYTQDDFSALLNRPAGGPPFLARYRRRPLVENVADQVYGIADIAPAVGLSIPAAQRIGNRTGTVIENIIDEINGIADVQPIVAIGVSRPAIANLPE